MAASARRDKMLQVDFKGHGNGDVYADLNYGDRFTVKAIPLSESGYTSLDALERDAIQTYDACECGYNKTKGNGRRKGLI